MDVEVGDVLEIHNRENIPADLVMLSCSDPKGTCFVMTSNLDGETNLKPRVLNPDLRAAMASMAAPPSSGGAGVENGGVEGGQAGGVLALAARGAVVECDLPNQNLEHFQGTLAVRGKKEDTKHKNMERGACYSLYMMVYMGVVVSLQNSLRLCCCY